MRISINNKGVEIRSNNLIVSIFLALLIIPLLKGGVMIMEHHQALAGITFFIVLCLIITSVFSWCDKKLEIRVKRKTVKYTIKRILSTEYIEYKLNEISEFKTQSRRSFNNQETIYSLHMIVDGAEVKIGDIGKHSKNDADILNDWLENTK